MRELKFRVWDSRYNEFIRPDYGLIGFCYPLDGRIAALTSSGEPMEDWTIEQYTGLKDKNGKEIYEGDIVRYGRHIGGIIPPEHRTEAVSWWAGEEEYYPCCTTSGFSLPYSEDGYEVIGNIHENPELLEEK